jgi:hypothetical protein
MMRGHGSTRLPDKLVDEEICRRLYCLPMQYAMLVLRRYRAWCRWMDGRLADEGKTLDAVLQQTEEQWRHDRYAEHNSIDGSRRGDIDMELLRSCYSMATSMHSSVTEELSKAYKDGYPIALLLDRRAFTALASMSSSEEAVSIIRDVVRKRKAIKNVNAYVMSAIGVSAEVQHLTSIRSPRVRNAIEQLLQTRGRKYIRATHFDVRIVHVLNGLDENKAIRAVEDLKLAPLGRVRNMCGYIMRVCQQYLSVPPTPTCSPAGSCRHEDVMYDPERWMPDELDPEPDLVEYDPEDWPFDDDELEPGEVKDDTEYELRPCESD